MPHCRVLFAEVTAELTPINGVPPIGASEEEDWQIFKHVWLFYLLGYRGQGGIGVRVKPWTRTGLTRTQLHSSTHGLGPSQAGLFDRMRANESGGKRVRLDIPNRQQFIMKIACVPMCP